MCEMRVAIGMLAALRESSSLGGCSRVHAAGARPRSNSRPAGRRQRRGQLRATLTRPAQRRVRIALRERIHQALQRGGQAGLILFQIRSAGAGRRTRPGAAPSPPANSRRPSGSSRRHPVAADTSASPPYPMAIDSAAAQRRRARSLRTGDITTNFATIVPSRSSSASHAG